MEILENTIRKPSPGGRRPVCRPGRMCPCPGADGKNGHCEGEARGNPPDRAGDRREAVHTGSQ